MPVAGVESWQEDEDYSKEEVVDAVEMHDKLEGDALGGYEEFQWSKSEEPHQIRRRALIKAHPEVLKLVGPDIATAYWTAGFVSIQLFLAYQVRNIDWVYIVLVAATIGGLLAQSLTLAMHEISHNLAFRTQFPNLVLGIFANLPMGLPAFGTFRRYHLEHHKYQGEHGVDVDVPTKMEAQIFRSRPMKFLWMFLYPAFYSLRPLVVSPRSPGAVEIATVISQVAFDAAVFYFWGPKALTYLIISTLLGMGLHVMAGHFVAEHAAMVRGQETYSYYGPLNIFAFNVGYHNEHHDLAGVPWTRLPQLRAMAPEFYELPQHHSWAKVVYMWIMGSEAQQEAEQAREDRVERTRRARSGSRGGGSDSGSEASDAFEEQLEQDRRASAGEYGPFSRVKRNTLNDKQRRIIEKMDKRRA